MASVIERLRALRRGSNDGFDRKLLAPMILGAILNPVNSSIIAVSLVPIGVAFGAPPAQTAWLVSALYLATAIGQPVVGRMIDTYGARRMFLAATSLVGVAGIVGATAPHLWVLVVARVILGFGTCAGYPAAMQLIRNEARRTGVDSPASVLTVLAISTQTIAVIGPPLGGTLIGLGGWRTTLAVNIPLSLVAIMLGLWRLPKSPRPRGRVQLDSLGILLFAGALVSLLLFLMHPGSGNWYLPVITVVAGAAFAVWELRVQRPFLDLRVLGSNHALLRTYTRAVFAYIVSYTFLYGYTQWLEDGRGLPATHAGLLQLPLFAIGIVVSATTGRRKEVRGKLLVGAVGQVVLGGLLLILGPHTAWWLLVVVAVVAGVPQGLNSLALQNSVYHQADPELMASSAGLLRTFGYLGAIIASAAQGAFFGKAADTPGMHELALFVLVVAALFLLLTLADRGLAAIGAKTGGKSTADGDGCSADAADESGNSDDTRSETGESPQQTADQHPTGRQR